jgi:hypothetical protein
MMLFTLEGQLAPSAQAVGNEMGGINFVFSLIDFTLRFILCNDRQ